MSLALLVCQGPVLTHIPLTRAGARGLEKLVKSMKMLYLSKLVPNTCTPPLKDKRTPGREGKCKGKSRLHGDQRLEMGGGSKGAGRQCLPGRSR